MYIINSSTIDGADLNVNVTIQLDSKTSVICNVPVKAPRTKDDVIAAVEKRELAEITQFEAAPVLNAIKSELETKYVGKASTEIVKG